MLFNDRFEQIVAVARVCYPNELPVEKITSQPKTIERYRMLCDAVAAFDAKAAAPESAGDPAETPINAKK